MDEAKATSVTLTALSMISMLIRIATALRLLSAPKRPITKSTAPRTRKWLSVIMRGLLLPADHDRADDGNQQHHRGDLERQHVAVCERTVEQLAELHHRAAGGVGERQRVAGRTGCHRAAVDGEN